PALRRRNHVITVPIRQYRNKIISCINCRILHMVSAVGPFEVFESRRFAANLPSKMPRDRSFALQKLFRTEFFYEPRSSSCAVMAAKHALMRKWSDTGLQLPSGVVRCVLDFIPQQGRHLPWTLP